MAKRLWVALSMTPAALLGCHSSNDGPPEQQPTDRPSAVTKVTSGGFTSPRDAVASPDGKTFYFTATDPDANPAVFSTGAAAGSTASVLAAGTPLEVPIGLVMSCDGGTLYVADVGGDTGSVLAIPAAGGAPVALSTTGLVRPGGLAMGPDCKTLFATGHTTDGIPALFAVSIDGGVTRAVFSGDPLIAPTGLHVDDQGTAWVMDHLAVGASGEGVLFAIPKDGSKATEVVSNLRMGTPGGVSLTSGGGIAVMPTRDADGHARLTSVEIATGERQELATPDITDPAGLRTARKAAVFAVVDSEGGAIYRAE